MVCSCLSVPFAWGGRREGGGGAFVQYFYSHNLHLTSKRRRKGEQKTYTECEGTCQHVRMEVSRQMLSGKLSENSRCYCDAMRTARNLNALTQVNQRRKLRKKSPQENMKIRITLTTINCEIFKKIRPNRNGWLGVKTTDYLLNSTRI